MKSQDDLSTQNHRLLVGAIGFSLPWLVLSIADVRAPNLAGQPLLQSLSQYYWTSAVIAFEGGLSALAVFLLTYQGYDNEYRRRDRIAAIIAGIAALLVGFYPTSPPADFRAPQWWHLWMHYVHLGAATVLFGSFIFFALFQFPKSNKKNRNVIYKLCGVAMIACMVWLFVAQVTGGSIFWSEALALQFFAISWLVKGRIDEAVVRSWQKLPMLQRI